MNSIFTIGIYNFKKLFRNIKSTGIMFVLPIIFISVFGFAFGGTNQDTTYDIAIIKNQDPSYKEFKNVVESVPIGLEGENKSDKKLFNLQEIASIEDGEKLVNDNKITFFFEWDGEKAIAYGESTNFAFPSLASGIQNIAAKFRGIEIDFFEIKSIDQRGDDFSGFDFLVPGLIVYSMLLMIPVICNEVSEIVEKKKIFRFFTAKVKSYHIILGMLWYQIILALIQIGISFFAVSFFGFELKESLLTAFVIAIPMTFFTSGVGLFIGAFSKDQDMSSNLGTVASIILGFFSGSFIVGVENIMRFSVFGYEMSFSEIFPSKYATDALTQILLYNGGLQDVIKEMIILSASGLLILILGILFYQKNQLNRIN